MAPETHAGRPRFRRAVRLRNPHAERKAEGGPERGQATCRSASRKRPPEMRPIGRARRGRARPRRAEDFVPERPGRPASRDRWKRQLGFVGDPRVMPIHALARAGKAGARHAGLRRNVYLYQQDPANTTIRRVHLFGSDTGPRPWPGLAPAPARPDEARAGQVAWPRPAAMAAPEARSDPGAPGWPWAGSASAVASAVRRGGRG